LVNETPTPLSRETMKMGSRVVAFLFTGVATSLSYHLGVSAKTRSRILARCQFIRVIAHLDSYPVFVANDSGAVVTAN
jgi:hypothetical protein